MKALEIKLNREFKALQKELEDYWFEEGNKDISEFTDKVGREKYFEIQGIAAEIEKLTQKEDFHFDDELNFALDKFFKTIEDFQNYINPNIKDGFQKDFFDVAGGKSKEIIDEIKTIEAMAYYANLQKLANTINCRTWQSIGRITFIINTVVEEIMPVYKKTMNDEIIRVKKILDNKVEEIKLKISKEKVEEVSKITIKKIFDYKEMDKLIKMSGYEPVRQAGDHKIYSNGVKSVPVPQHTLGKDLSYKIQKQIV